MVDIKAINAVLDKRLVSMKRDGVSVLEAADWLAAAGLLDKGKSREKHLRELLRTGRISGAYQFPNKRWVIVNRSRLPDGIKRVVPIKEAAESLRISEASLRHHVRAGKLTPLDFGPAMLFFLEEEIKRFGSEAAGESYSLLFPDERIKKQSDIDKLRRQLYYLRSDIRLIAERIEELINLLE
ncbi:MAG: hypothetical protein HY770_06550 [Chitinivibrionia bacterium]|nr:hypothetical protein [Chitinivibrionia bacterium]